MNLYDVMVCSLYLYLYINKRLSKTTKPLQTLLIAPQAIDACVYCIPIFITFPYGQYLEYDDTVEPFGFCVYI